MDITKVKCVLIQNNKNIPTDQAILNSLYEKIIANHVEYSENIELPYITQYLEDMNTLQNIKVKETFCFSKKSGRTGMSTSYLIDSLHPRSKNSAIVCLDKETYDVLGVLTFNYMEWSEIDYDYNNSLYIDSFCTNQQMSIPGIGKLLLTTIIKATTDLGFIDNIFLEAATKDSEGFYEKFNFKATGKIDDKMKEYKYTINIVHHPDDEPYGAPYAAAYSEPYDEPYVTAYSAPYSAPYDTAYGAPYGAPYSAPYATAYSAPYNEEENYVTNSTGGKKSRLSRDKRKSSRKIYGHGFNFYRSTRRIKNKKKNKSKKKLTRISKKRHSTSRKKKN